MRTALVILALSFSTAAWSGAECRKTGEVCVAPNETRMVNGASVYRECWKYQDTYECLAPELTEDAQCEELRSRGCSQIDSKCIDTAGGACMSYEQTYECPAGEPTSQSVVDCGDRVFCVDGSCFDTSYSPNTGMPRSAALLSVMNALSDELSADNMEVFKGDDRRCGVSLFDAIGALNCCAVSGWAEGVLDCSFDEKTLADLRNAKRCHYVGSYCSNKTLLGVCLVRSQTYCCFGSKLSRIIAEQGRTQIGRGWGTAESPDCGGFTLDEVKNLDFSAMDLSEFYDDVTASMPNLDAGDLRNRVNQGLQRQLP